MSEHHRRRISAGNNINNINNINNTNNVINKSMPMQLDTKEANEKKSQVPFFQAFPEVKPREFPKPSKNSYEANDFSFYLKYKEKEFKRMNDNKLSNVPQTDENYVDDLQKQVTEIYQTNILTNSKYL